MSLEMKLCSSSRRRVESCYGSLTKSSCFNGEDESDKKNENVIGFSELFRYATLGECLALWSGILFCGIMSVGIPLGNIVYGEFTTLLVERTSNVTSTSTSTIVLALFGGGRVLTNPTSGERYDALLEDSKAFAVSNIVTSILQMIFGVTGIDLLNYAALNQIGRIRRLLLESMLRQDMSWYDTKQGTNFATKMSEDIEKMKEGMGEKIGIFVYLIVSFVISVIVAFCYGWKLTLVILSGTPVIVLATAVVAKVQSNLSVKELKAYGSAGVVAEEVLGSIRTVVAFGGEDVERERYTQELKPAKEVGSKKGLYSGLGAGIMWLIIYISYAVAFYYGITLIVHDRHLEEKEYTPAVLIIVFFGVLVGAQNLGLTAPYIDAFNSARAAAHGVFAIIERKSDIDSLSPEGAELENPREDIVFSDIYFHYPSRPDVKVLRGLNLKVKAGETLALVGSSGCGKSTCIQLLQRLYDPSQGKVTIAGRDIREYSLSSLRGAIGLVGQEPVLFAASIKDNIRYGKPDCTQADIEEAAKNANCHTFIKKLPNGYHTILGERGAQLSGGQKQRIAIARALVRQPAILLLDEATSALDSHSQAKVQKALDKACLGRTTIVVSHRLSTIVNADKIVVIDQGQVVEEGTHSELMELQGSYYKLVNTDVPATHPKVAQGLKPSRSRGVRRSLVDSLTATSDLSFEETPSSSSETSIETLTEKPKVKPKKPSFMRILKLNLPEWPYITVGCIASLVNGATLPLFAIIFGGIYGVLSLEDGDEVIRRTIAYCFWFLGIGIVTGSCTFAQIYMFSISGARLTARLRSAAFSAMLRQEMGWFDNVKNSVGALGSRLAGDCSAIQGATGPRIGSILNSFSTMVLGFALSFYFSWKLTLVSASVLPLVMGAVFLEAYFTTGVSVGEKGAIEASSRVATEAITNIKTVASLCQERAVEERYDLEMRRVSSAAQKKVRMRGFVFSLGQTAPILGYAVSLSYGGLMVANKEIHYEDVIIVSEALIFGSWMLGQALAYAPNVNTAVVSAKNLFALLDREPKITSSPDAKPLQGWKADGDIEYDSVEFCYPNRPETAVLQEFALTVGRGRSVALVGPSGCGKSTCIQLLQRLYDPIQGDIYLDSQNIVSDIPLKELRSQLGLVGQEPVLFDRTIAANIRYGDNSREVSMQEVIKAATSANIHGFIIGLPLGYSTRLGPQGTQLSGGQKQRIAIARALVRDPRVLLLDEATSALDAQSEKLVQEALDKASVGRTCITIAHRLNTIRNAHLICVLDNGSIAEAGSHKELMERGGIYHKLYLQEQKHQG